MPRIAHLHTLTYFSAFIHYLVREGLADLIGYVIGFGGELDKQDKDGNTPLVSRIIPRSIVLIID